MSKKLVAVISILVILLFTGGKPTTPANNEKTSALRTYGFEYFPLDTAKTLIYDSNFGETISRITKQGNESVVVNESEDFKYIQKFLVRDNGIYITRTEQHLDVFLFISAEADIRYNEPALRIPLPLHAGSEWLWQGTEYKDGDSSDISIQGRFKGIDSVSTEAGTFECVNIELHVESEKGSKSVVNEWLSPGIGLVKLSAVIEGSGITGMLQSVLGYDEIYFKLREII